MGMASKQAQDVAEVVTLLEQHGLGVRYEPQKREPWKPDILVDALPELPGFRVDVKRVKERIDIWTALWRVGHVADPSLEDTVPLLVFKRDKSRWYACLPLEDLLGILEGALNGVSWDSCQDAITRAELRAYEMGRADGYKEASRGLK